MKISVYLLALCSFLGTLSAYGEDYFQSATDPKVYRLVHSLDIHHLQRAQTSVFEGQPEVAWREVTFVLHRVPNYPKALELLGQVAQRMHRVSLAQDYFERAIAENPSAGEVHYIYGLFLHRKGDVSKAESEYQSAIKLEPELPAAHYNYGLLLFERGDKKAANEHAQIAYSHGYPLPGLRDMLKSAGAWKANGSAVTANQTPKQGGKE